MRAHRRSARPRAPPSARARSSRSRPRSTRASSRPRRGSARSTSRISSTRRWRCSRAATRAWVLYKLDRGIDHVLIDEAQDTNPEQWEILRQHHRGFHRRQRRATARRDAHALRGRRSQAVDLRLPGRGAAANSRTSRRIWKRKVARGGACASRTCADAVVPLRAGGALGGRRDLRGRARISRACPSRTRRSAPCTRARARTRRASSSCGRPRRPPRKTEPDAWVLPGRRARAARAARRGRAPHRRRRSKCWTTKGDETGRVWKAGDVLVLVRKRGAAFEAVIRALEGGGRAGGRRRPAQYRRAHRRARSRGGGPRGAAAGRRPHARNRAEIAARRPDRRRSHPHRRRSRRRRIAARGARAPCRRGDATARRGCEALARWRELARMHGPFGFFATLLGPLRRALAARGAARQRGGRRHRRLPVLRASIGDDARRPRSPTFLDRFESAVHTIKRDLDSVQRRGAGDDRARRQGPRSAASWC